MIRVRRKVCRSRRWAHEQRPRSKLRHSYYGFLYISAVRVVSIPTPYLSNTVKLWSLPSCHLQSLLSAPLAGSISALCSTGTVYLSSFTRTSTSLISALYPPGTVNFSSLRLKHNLSLPLSTPIALSTSGLYPSTTVILCILLHWLCQSLLSTPLALSISTL